MELIDSVTEDIFSRLPLVVRNFRRKIIRKGIAEGLETGISPAHIHIMKTIQKEGPTSVTGIGQKLSLSSPRMTYLTDSLVEQGMIERTPDTSDRRIINISLTDKGKKYLDEYQKIIIGNIRTILSALSVEDLQELSSSLKSLDKILAKLD